MEKASPLSALTPHTMRVHIENSHVYLFTLFYVLIVAY